MEHLSDGTGLLESRSHKERGLLHARVGKNYPGHWLDV